MSTALPPIQRTAIMSAAPSGSDLFEPQQALPTDGAVSLLAGRNMIEGALHRLKALPRAVHGYPPQTR